MTLLLLAGCFGPTSLEVEQAEVIEQLRQEVDTLEGRVEVLQADVEAKQRVIERLEAASPPGPPATDWIVDGVVVRDAMPDLASMARFARVIPHTTDQGRHGYRISGIRRGTPAALLGFMNGDVVMAVNGRALDDLDASMRALDDLETSDRIEVDVVRRGVPETVVIHLE